MKMIAILALAASQSACVTTGATTTTERLAAADPVIAQLQARYERAQGWALPIGCAPAG